LPDYQCRYICAKETVLEVCASTQRNPAVAAEDAERRRPELPFALIEVWDGNARLLIWKRSSRMARRPVHHGA
jgi:hypothetical protein